MAIDIAQLQIRIDTNGVAQSQTTLLRFGDAAATATRATDGLTLSANALSVALGSIAANAATRLFTLLAEGAEKVVTVGRQFDIYNAQLATVTGSTHNAAIAMEALLGFAKRTPYNLAQSIEAFTKLTNYGLDPSERALTSYGNTAAATGKDLIQMTDAVAAATVGQFRRLKEFGILTHYAGDEVTFYFQGVATTVKNNAEEIQNYLRGIGENVFPDAMQRRMDTLDGALSNLGDEWTKLFNNIKESGVGDFVKESAQKAEAALTALNTQITSGSTGATLSALGEDYAKVFDDIASGATMAKDAFYAYAKDLQTEAGLALTAIDRLVTYLPDSAQSFLVPYLEGARLALFEFRDSAPSAFEKIVQEFREFPANLRASIQIVATELVAGVSYFRNYGAGVVTLLQQTYVFLADLSIDAGRRVGGAFTNGLFEALQKVTGPLGSEIRALLGPLFNPPVPGAFAEAAKKALEDYTAAVQKTAGDVLAQNKVIAEGRSANIDDILEEKETDIYAIEARKLALEDLIETQKILNDAPKGTQDRLAPFSKQPETPDTSEADAKLREHYLRSLDQLKQSLLTEEEVVVEHYGQRQALLEEALSKGDITEKEFEESSVRSYTVYQEKLSEIHMREIDRRKRATETFHNTIRQLDRQVSASAFATAREGLSTIEDLAEKGSSLQKAAFAAGKAIAIAQAIVQTELAALAALAPPPLGLGPVAGVPYSTAIRAIGYSSVAIIGAQAVAGVTSHEHGGYISPGSFGIVGEAGPELVRGPAHITSARATADMAKSSSGNGNITVVVNNNAGADVRVQESTGPDGKTIEILVNRVVAKVASDIRKGGSVVADSLDSAYGLQRRGS